VGDRTRPIGQMPGGFVVSACSLSWLLLFGSNQSGRLGEPAAPPGEVRLGMNRCRS